MKRYAVSWGRVGKRKSFVVRSPRWLAVFVGRHLWRVIGKYHSVQIEEGVFSTSPIRTANAIVTREADQWLMNWQGEGGFSRDSRTGVHPEDTFTRPTPAMRQNKDGTWTEVPPNVLRQGHYVKGFGPLMLLEGTRTNLCLWSDPCRMS